MKGLRLINGRNQIRRVLLSRTPIFKTKLSDAQKELLAQVFNESLPLSQFIQRIFAEVDRDGDDAVERIASALGDQAPRPHEISRDELLRARSLVSADLQAALELSAGRIQDFHQKAMPTDWMDSSTGCGQIFRPVERAGIYAPGGRASYPSSLLMTAIPAITAGVSEVIIATPPGPDGNIPLETLAAAEIAGADKVISMGGAQAVAALSLGTNSVPKVDVISGPGNIFVVMAMQFSFGMVGIPSLPGPTETLLIGDSSANAAEVAADLLAQAEHDPMASPILLTPSGELAESVMVEIDKQIDSLPRSSIASTALTKCGGIGLVESIPEAIELANEYAPEHLCLLTKDADKLLNNIHNAGGIFVGSRCSEVLGDYVAGPSHVMPVGGTARHSSPVSVTDFMKRSSIFAIPDDQIAHLSQTAAKIARAEGLEGHARAAEYRLPSKGNY
tara:strand:+ start:2630 stop:3970 length:1341 start_codon:yes stop_codon:yes gene_type:complete